ncbi:hypothetical protein J7643_15945 [bacterium]|nr:hypothetical protein [bacterium]
MQYTPAEVKAIRVTLKDMGLKTVALQRTFQGSELSSRLSTRNGKRIFTCNLENLTFKDKNRQIEYAGTIEAFLDFSIGQVTLIGTAEIPAFIVKQNKVTDVSAGTLWLMPTPQPSNGSALIQLPIIDSVPATTTID